MKAATNADFSAAVRAFEARNFVLARSLFARAASAGYPAGSNNLAVMILGEGNSAAGTEEAAGLLKQAASGSLPEAKFNLGVLELRAHPGEPPSALAETLWGEAAAAGFEPAALNLAIGVITDAGSDPVARGPAKRAVETAATHGLAVALYACGIIAELEAGEHGATSRAESFYQQAALQDFGPAFARLAHLRRKSSQAESPAVWQKYFPGTWFQPGETGELPRVYAEAYVVRPGEVISMILARSGIELRGGAAQIYGPGGYLEHLRRLNPKIQDWNNLAAGTTVKLLVPDYRITSPSLYFDESLQMAHEDPVPASEPNSFGGGREAAEARPRYGNGSQNVGAAGSAGQGPQDRYYAVAGPAYLTGGPSGTLQPTNTDAAANPALLADAGLKAKAWSLSVFDAVESGMENVYDGFTAARMNAYLGVRYGYSLTGSSDPLTGQMRTFGLVAEARDGKWRGWRFYYDYVPKVEATVNGNDTYCGWSRLLLGYAFEFSSPWAETTFHLTPKLGNYRLDATLPHSPDAAPDDPPLVVHVLGEFAAGIEADVEKASFWYVLRASVARDVPAILNSLAKGGGSIDTSRIGVDLFLKGGGLNLGGKQLSMAYLMYFAREQIDVTTGNPDDGVLSLVVPFLGAGVSVAW